MNTVHEHHPSLSWHLKVAENDLMAPQAKYPQRVACIAAWSR